MYLLQDMYCVSCTKLERTIRTPPVEIFLFYFHRNISKQLHTYTIRIISSPPPPKKMFTMAALSKEASNLAGCCKQRAKYYWSLGQSTAIAPLNETISQRDKGQRSEQSKGHGTGPRERTRRCRERRAGVMWCESVIFPICRGSHSAAGEPWSRARSPLTPG